MCYDITSSELIPYYIRNVLLMTEKHENDINIIVIQHDTNRVID